MTRQRHRARAANHADGDNMAALSAGGWARWPTVLEQYYDLHHVNHQLIHQHSNGLILLGVGPSHPQLQPPRRVVEVMPLGRREVGESRGIGEEESGASFFTARDMVCRHRRRRLLVHRVRASAAA